MHITASPAASPFRFSVLPQVTSEVSLDARVDGLVSSRQRSADAARASYRAQLVNQVGTSSVIGAGIGYVLGQAYALPHGAVIGPAFGAVAGAYVAWEKLHREQTGRVGVCLDGVISRRPVVGDLSRPSVTPQEARFQLLAEGAGAQSRVPLADAPAAEASHEQLAPWKVAAESFRSLAGQRRLVADLGVTTGDGQNTVQLVDGLAAARLAATGGEVFLVSAGQPQDAAHSMERQALNRSGSRSHAEHFRYNERAVDYTLTRLERPEQLQAPSQGAGVPEGMFGLLKNAARYSEVVDMGALQARGATYSPEWGTRRSQSDIESWNSLERAHASALNLQSGVVTRNRPNLPVLGALLGTCAGLMMSMAFTGPGVPGPAVMAATVGFLGGRSLGRLALDSNRS